MAQIKENGDNQEMLSLDLSPIRRRKICIDDDMNRILELDTTDMGVITRLNEFYPKLEELEKEYGGLEMKFDENGNLEEESFSKLGDAISSIDARMRECIDGIFNSNVSEMCAPTGNMFDPINGSFRFEYIIDALSSLYEAEIEENLKKRKELINKHTSKYKSSRGKKDR